MRCALVIALAMANALAAQAAETASSRGAGAPAHGAPAAAVAALPSLARGLDAAPEAATASGETSPAVAGALDAPRLQAFIERRAERERARRPDLFADKMQQAAASDAAFNRAMPDLFYDLLRRSPAARKLRASPKIWLAGDLHAGNVELVDFDGSPLPQANDFDDSGDGPAALDDARMLVGAGVLGHGQAQRRQLIEEARGAYLDSLGLKFGDWRRKAAEEAAVRTGPSVERHWFHHGGRPVEDAALERRLRALTGIDSTRWKLFDRAGAGLSSIGVLRYLFAHEGKDHARELKELRAPAIAEFTRQRYASERRRQMRAYELLRRVPVEVEGLRGLGSDWMLRRREGLQRSLNLEHPRSTARVLGGLAAQLHRRQADAAALARAMDAIPTELAAGWLRDMAAMRLTLSRLLRAGTWRTLE